MLKENLKFQFYTSTRRGSNQNIPAKSGDSYLHTQNNYLNTGLLLMQFQRHTNSYTNPLKAV